VRDRRSVTENATAASVLPAEALDRVCELLARLGARRCELERLRARRLEAGSELAEVSITLFGQAAALAVRPLRVEVYSGPLTRAQNRRLEQANEQLSALAEGLLEPAWRRLGARSRPSALV
jgi:hypothetical protein